MVLSGIFTSLFQQKSLTFGIISKNLTVYDDPEWEGNYDQYLSELRRGLIGSKDSIRIYFSMKSVLLESKNGMQD